MQYPRINADYHDSIVLLQTWNEQWPHAASTVKNIIIPYACYGHDRYDQGGYI